MMASDFNAASSLIGSGTVSTTLPIIIHNYRIHTRAKFLRIASIRSSFFSVGSLHIIVLHQEYCLLKYFCSQKLSPRRFQHFKQGLHQPSPPSSAWNSSLRESNFCYWRKNGRVDQNMRVVMEWSKLRHFFVRPIIHIREFYVLVTECRTFRVMFNWTFLTTIILSLNRIATSVFFNYLP